MKNQHTDYIFRKFMIVIFFNLLAFQTYSHTKSCNADFEFQIDTLTFQVSFNNTSSGSPTFVLWDFGDGETSAEYHPVHQYQDSGTYMVCLEIWGGGDCQDIICKTLTIGEDGSINCEANFEFNSTDRDLEIQFTNLSGSDIDSAFWDFGDGNFSNSLHPIHVYGQEDSYLVCLNIFVGNCFDMLCLTVNASYADCQVEYSYNEIQAPFDFQFINESIGTFDDWLWDFGDGNTSTLEQPSHTFSTYGSYKIILQGSRDNGIYCSDTISHVIDIKEPDTCSANFTFVIDENRPNIVVFSDSSIGDISYWQWDFNDYPGGGSYSYGQNPSHVFPANGDYQVTLTIGNDNGTSNITKLVHIVVPLIVDFTFQLDSLNEIPNTFIFQSQIEGFYDNLIWNFDNEVVLNKEDTTHAYAEQDKDYQVALIAQYTFNDTSILKKQLAKGLTTSEYFDMGGQVFFGDSLLNNPSSTGDEALAYLYRVDGNNMIPIDTNYFHYLGYYWFPQKLKAYYIVKTALTPNSTHYSAFAPTYVGNTTQWDEAEIINLAQNKFREDVYLVEELAEKSGTTWLEGSVFDILNINIENLEAVVCLFDMDENLLNYQYADDEGKYLFKNISKGHYMLSADVTGIPVRPQLIFIDGKQNQEFKTANLITSSDIFPNPASNYSILSYTNTGKFKEISIQIIAQSGLVLSEKQLPVHQGKNFFSIDLTEFSKGLLMVKVMDGDGQKILKLLHY